VPCRSRDSSVSIEATSWTTEVQFPAGVMTAFFSPPPHPDRLWGPSSPLSDGYWGSYHEGKAAGVWSWAHTSL
jgi:hypothetical protein